MLRAGHVAGDAHGLGQQREEELREAAKALGVRSSHSVASMPQTLDSQQHCHAEL